jgi:hypothetical protein
MVIAKGLHPLKSGAKGLHPLKSGVCARGSQAGPLVQRSELGTKSGHGASSLVPTPVTH